MYPAERDQNTYGYSFSVINQDSLETYGGSDIGLIFDVPDEDIVAALGKMSARIHTGDKHILKFMEFISEHKKVDESNVLFSKIDNPEEELVITPKDIVDQSKGSKNNEIIIRNNSQVKAKAVFIIVDDLEDFQIDLTTLKNNGQIKKYFSNQDLVRVYEYVQEHNLPIILMPKNKELDSDEIKSTFLEVFPEYEEVSPYKFVKAEPLDSTSVTRRDFIKGVAGVVASLAFDPLDVLGQPLDDTYQKYFSFFDENAHESTGLSSSYYGGSTSVAKYGASTYDMSLRAIGSPLGSKIISTYANNITRANGGRSPQTQVRDYLPSGGVVNIARIKNFEEESWWQRWPFDVRGGENAWIGMAALHNYQKEKKPKFLEFAKGRAEFLIQMQDSDGGLRFGPKGQWHESGDQNFYWNIKSTENNESALYFFDMLYAVTKDERYKKTADKIYTWLVEKMYDKKNNVFARGASYRNGAWQRDGVEKFATDTTSWAPFERMLEDSHFGATKADRLQRFESMMRETEKLTGVFKNGSLKGVSFSPSSKEQDVISIEWSSQFALRYLKLSRAYASLNNKEKANEYQTKYKNLIVELGRHFKKEKDSLIAPYAVYVDDRPAEQVPTGHGWSTPEGSAAVASTYYAFAVSGFDPLLLDGGQDFAMIGNRELHLNKMRWNPFLKDFPSVISGATNPSDFVASDTEASQAGGHAVITFSNQNDGVFVKTSSELEANDVLLNEVIRLVRLNKKGILKGKIPEVLDVGVGENGLMWVKLKGIVGGKNLLKSNWGDVSPLKAMDILIQIAKMLSELHKVGVVHNDIKSKNIIINAQGEVMLIDFGSADEIGKAFKPRSYFI